MLRHLLFTLATVFSLNIVSATPLFESTKNLPVAYQGRFRSLDSASRLWLYDIYHKQQLKKSDLPLFLTQNPSALDLLWQIHFFGHSNWDDSPFFWIHYASSKSHLHLNPLVDRFSYNELYPSLSEEKNTDNTEIAQLAQQIQLYLSYQGSLNDFEIPFEEFYLKLKQQGRSSPKEIAQALEIRFPFNKRLQQAGATLKMLPSKFVPGEWVSLHAFKTKIYDQTLDTLTLPKNFTSFSDQHFHNLRNAYFDLEQTVLAQNSPEHIIQAVEQFANHYNTAYASLAGKPYKHAQGKSLTYPSESHLQAETIYYRLPLIEITLFAYALALIFISTRSKTILTLSALLVGFVIHTTILILRCYILERPPVSNMFETVIYVPWIAIALGLVFYSILRSRAILGAAIFASFVLLLLLKITQVDSRLENVQAVLDSQFWLIIHVLMVVASYGAFAISGILGHIYLIKHAIKNKESATSFKIAKGILYTMYVGVALLIPGTILGGVWAAESWGRFWDWDPKESWAFISACVYLLFIHAYTFRYIRDLGLAVGAVVGLVAISFTWYGVNYVLGTGLHSYGFGSGGEWLYFLYVGMEAVFILWTSKIWKWTYV